MNVISKEGKPIKVWASLFEPEAQKQVENVSTLPFIFKHVAVMPDAHAGKGSTVGTVIATKGAIIPSCVGVDIGCGMAAVKLPFKIDLLDGKLAQLRFAIESVVPVAHNGNQDLSKEATAALLSLSCMAHTECINMDGNSKLKNQLGSLGGGNHFIEICFDEDQNAWAMLHSGSRNIGKETAEKHIDRAKNLMRQYFISVPDPDLAYLAQGTMEFHSYISDLMWCQHYAKFNRAIMMHKVLEQILNLTGHETHEPIINCHHNYTKIEHHFGENVWVTRKGAVSAKLGELGIIPGSMGTKSYIVKGLGNPESFCSCSHGAGRRMSRSKAKATFTQKDLAEQTLGVECRKDEDVIDEIPAAYKDLDTVMNDQADLVQPIHTLKAVMCIKG